MNFPPYIAISKEFRLIQKCISDFKKHLKKKKWITTDSEFDTAFDKYLDYRLYFEYVGVTGITSPLYSQMPNALSDQMSSKFNQWTVNNEDRLKSRRAVKVDIDVEGMLQDNLYLKIQKAFAKAKIMTVTEKAHKREAERMALLNAMEIDHPSVQILDDEVPGASQRSHAERVQSTETDDYTAPTLRRSSRIKRISYTESNENDLSDLSDASSPVRTPKKKVKRRSSTISRPKSSSNENRDQMEIDENNGTDMEEMSSSPNNDDDQNDPDYEFPTVGVRVKKTRTLHPVSKETKNAIKDSIRDLRERRFQEWQRSVSDDETDTIQDPIFKSVPITLDPREPCPFCGALHFGKIHICCSDGKIFAPPLRKLPPKIFHYHMEDYSGRSIYKNLILSYNTAFAMASMTYHHGDIPPHGAQVVKPVGRVGHYPSCAIPALQSNMFFGNYYVYQGEEAYELRQDRFAHLDPTIMRDLQEVMDEHNTLGKLYYAMGQVIEEQKKHGDIRHIRMKVVDVHRVPENLILSHKSTYRAPTQSGDHIALFYPSSMEQQVKLPGLNIYAKRRPRMAAQPIFSSDPRIPALCYPLLYPYGEIPWRYGTLELFHGERSKMTYHDRLVEWAVKHESMAKVWELNFSLEKEINDYRSKNWNPDGADPNLELSAHEDSENEDSIEHDYNRQYGMKDTEDNEEEENQSRVAVEFIERDGEVYPVYKRGKKSPRVLGSPIADDYFFNTAADLLDSFDNDILPIGEAGEMEELGMNIGVEEYQNLEMDLQEEQSDEENERNDGEHLENAEREINELIDEIADDIDDIFDEFETRENKKRKFVSFLEYVLYIHQEREEYPNRFLAAGKLGQLQLTDMCTRLFEQRFNCAMEHNTETRKSTKKRFLHALQKTATRVGRTIGCLTTMPHTVPGSPRDLQMQYEHAVAMCNTMGKSDLFITATCNVNWPEIKDNIPAGRSWADYPFLVNEVFKKKLDRLLELIFGKQMPNAPAVCREPGVFGQVRWWTYSIEFQQRGPPHAHIIVSLKKKITTTAEVDKICQATLPTDNEELRQLVEDFQIHRPCEDDPTAYCRSGCERHWRRCRKGFPKDFSGTTTLGDRNYPELIRPDDGEKCTKHGYEADNRHVVAYNTTLLSLWRGHLNVEVISALTVVKYIFKYVFKGYDRVLVEALTSADHLDAAEMTVEGHLIFPKNITIHPGAKKQRQIQAKKMLRKAGLPLKDDNGKPMLVLNEYWICQDMRALTPCEAAWEFAKYRRHRSSHVVSDLFVHEEDEEPVSFIDGEEEELARKIQEKGVKTRFNGWMRLNQVDPDARELTYDQLPIFYKFDNGKWTKKRRIQKGLFGRVRSVHPSNKELFAIRLLCYKQKGVESFEDLRRVDGDLHPTYVSAAKALRLMNDQQEWRRAIDEASKEKMPSMLRRLLVSILVFNAVEDPLALWTEFETHFYENKASWSDRMKRAHALRHIESGLKFHGFTLERKGLPGYANRDLPETDIHDDSGMTHTNPQWSEQEAKNICEARVILYCSNIILQTLNEDQKAVFETITGEIDELAEEGANSYFIQGSGGTGKTRLMTALYHHFVGNGNTVMCVAHTGIAAMLLPFGSTAHHGFHIPITVEDTMRCNVHLESPEATALKKVSVVLWDEATMSERRILACVDRLMRDLHPENAHLLFGGIPFIFGGDWRQTLPIVAGVKGEGVIDYTMVGSGLWKLLKTFGLTQNMRAKDDPAFAEYLLGVGDGTENQDEDQRPEDQRVLLPFECLVESESQLIEKLFGKKEDSEEEKRKKIETSSILAVDNRTTFDVNKKVLKLLNGDLHEFKSIDEHDDNRGFTALDPESYHLQTPSGMPQHVLQLKVGAVVILLRNINVALGLVNGTRMIVEKIGKDVIYGRPLNPGPKTPEIVAIHRLMFAPSTAPTREYAFIRTQFPLRLAFCITCNRAQGQTLLRAGLILKSPCFSHGQLYVALSRVRKESDLFIFNADDNCYLTNNVVYKNIFSEL